jgi:hypothetical protein
VLPIAGATISTLIRTQGVGDLVRTFANTSRDGIDFQLTFIPASFDIAPDSAFDLKYMRALFEFGRQAGLDGSAWKRGAELQ